MHAGYAWCRCWMVMPTIKKYAHNFQSWKDKKALINALSTSQCNGPTAGPPPNKFCSFADSHVLVLHRLDTSWSDRSLRSKGGHGGYGWGHGGHRGYRRDHGGCRGGHSCNCRSGGFWVSKRCVKLLRLVVSRIQVGAAKGCDNTEAETTEAVEEARAATADLATTRAKGASSNPSIGFTTSRTRPVTGMPGKSGGVAKLNMHGPSWSEVVRTFFSWQLFFYNYTSSNWSHFSFIFASHLLWFGQLGTYDLELRYWGIQE